MRSTTGFMVRRRVDLKVDYPPKLVQSFENTISTDCFIAVMGYLEADDLLILWRVNRNFRRYIARIDEHYFADRFKSQFPILFEQLPRGYDFFTMIRHIPRSSNWLGGILLRLKSWRVLYLLAREDQLGRCGTCGNVDLRSTMLDLSISPRLKTCIKCNRAQFGAVARITKTDLLRILCVSNKDEFLSNNPPNAKKRNPYKRFGSTMNLYNIDRFPQLLDQSFTGVGLCSDLLQRHDRKSFRTVNRLMKKCFSKSDRALQFDSSLLSIRPPGYDDRLIIALVKEQFCAKSSVTISAGIRSVFIRWLEKAKCGMINQCVSEFGDSVDYACRLICIFASPVRGLRNFIPPTILGDCIFEDASKKYLKIYESQWSLFVIRHTSIVKNSTVKHFRSYRDALQHCIDTIDLDLSEEFSYDESFRSNLKDRVDILLQSIYQ